MRKAVFLDRDGTVIELVPYLCEADKIELIPGAAEAVAEIKQMGYLCVLVSNQSAVGRGLIDEKGVDAMHEKLNELLKARHPGAVFDGIYFCPFHPEALLAEYRKESFDRKPNPGLILKAARDFQIDLVSSWMAGDSRSDLEAGTRAGCKAALVRTGYGHETEKELRVNPGREGRPELILNSLAEFPRRLAGLPGRPRRGGDGKGNGP